MPNHRMLSASAITAAIGLAFAALSPALADQYDPPASYYSTATGTGATLESQLHNIIDGHTSRSYGDARQALPILDPDDSIPGNILLVYNSQSVSGTWDAGATWNREHTWPRSRGINSSGVDNSDLHQLRGCNPSVNSSRSNKPFDIVTNSTYWNPDQLDTAGVQWRGEIARAMFYCDIRYDGSDTNTENLQLVNGFPGTNQMGDLASMLDWHFEQPVDFRDRRRNHLIYSSADNPFYFQGNRNPFVDHPEYVWAIWGPTPNNSTLFVGANPEVDGSSDEMIDLGKVIVGSAPSLPSVSVMKIGANPTTWEAFTLGDLLVDETITHQTFVTGAQSASIPLTFAATASTGMTSGQVVIDNTDLTSAGAGQGVNDGDDTVTIFATAVDHSSGSFQSGVSLTTLNVDLGDIEQGEAMNSAPFDVFNNAGDPLNTADLVVGTINGSGDTGALTIDLTNGEIIAAGDMFAALASIDTNSSLGMYSATYTINVADENIPGSTAGAPLTLNLSANLIAALCAADINNDGVVDSADLGILIAAFGDAGVSPADVNGDLIVDTADLGILINEFGDICP